MFFSKKQKPSLVQAIALVHQATERAYVYLRDESHIPTTREMRQLELLKSTLSESQTTLCYICSILERRRNQS